MICCVLISTVSLVASASPEKPAAAELKKLQGTWSVVSVEVAGRTTPAEGAYTLTIAGDKLTQSMRGNELTGTIRVDPEAKPKSIDLVYGPDDTTLAVYELDGDDLKVCEARPGGKRPTAVTGKTGWLVTVYKRAKP